MQRFVFWISAGGIRRRRWKDLRLARLVDLQTGDLRSGENPDERLAPEGAVSLRVAAADVGVDAGGPELVDPLIGRRLVQPVLTKKPPALVHRDGVPRGVHARIARGKRILRRIP